MKSMMQLFITTMFLGGRMSIKEVLWYYEKRWISMEEIIDLILWREELML